MLLDTCTHGVILRDPAGVCKVQPEILQQIGVWSNSYESPLPKTTAAKELSNSPLPWYQNMGLNQPGITGYSL
eukprot:6464789-Amphidinium_carterae.1